MRYRKKPVVIDAVQFTESVRDAFLFDRYPLPKSVHYQSSEIDKDQRKAYKACFYIDTLEGRMEVSTGNWIITGVKGESYPCKPDIFELTYESVSDT